MLICYALEDRSPWFILAFAIARALGSAYGFLQGAWPFGLVEAVWSLVAVRRLRLAKSNGETTRALSPARLDLSNGRNHTCRIMEEIIWFRVLKDGWRLSTAIPYIALLMAPRMSTLALA